MSQKPAPQPRDTRLEESKKNWEYLYACELDAALKNNDATAYYFFWPLYLKERQKNKCKQYNPLHNIECNCEE
jgi:hypothetical protein